MNTFLFYLQIAMFSQCLKRAIQTTTSAVCNKTHTQHLSFRSSRAYSAKSEDKSEPYTIRTEENGIRTIFLNDPKKRLVCILFSPVWLGTESIHNWALTEYYEIVGESRPLSAFFPTHSEFFQKCISTHETKQSSKFLSDPSPNCFTIDV